MAEDCCGVGNYRFGPRSMNISKHQATFGIGEIEAFNAMQSFKYRGEIA